MVKSHPLFLVFINDTLYEKKEQKITTDFYRTSLMYRST